MSRKMSSGAIVATNSVAKSTSLLLPAQSKLANLLEWSVRTFKSEAWSGQEPILACASSSAKVETGVAWAQLSMRRV